MNIDLSLDAKAVKFLKQKELNLYKKNYNSSPNFDISPDDNREMVINQSQIQPQQRYLSSYGDVSEFKINPSEMLMSRA